MTYVLWFAIGFVGAVITGLVLYKKNGRLIVGDAAFMLFCMATGPVSILALLVTGLAELIVRGFESKTFDRTILEKKEDRSKK